MKKTKGGGKSERNDYRGIRVVRREGKDARKRKKKGDKVRRRKGD